MSFDLDQIIDRVMNNYSIILYNDDVNTIETVTANLIDKCGHGLYQAIQCVELAHLTGSCEIKRGRMTDLYGICKDLLESGFIVEINADTEQLV